MKVYTKRMLAWVLAAALLITCGISGLVLPAAAEDGNLFVNGDFEQGATAEWESSALIVSGQGKDGGWGYYQDRTETSTNVGTGLVRYKKALLSQMEAGTAYVLSFDYKTSGDAQAQLFMDKSLGSRTDVSGNLYGGVWLTKSVDTWVSMSIPFTTAATVDANTGWEFAIRAVGGAGGVWFDNFKLVKAPTAATAITLDKTALSMTAGDTAILTATVTPEGAVAEDIVWTTTDANVATVADGTVTAVGAGTATITATAGTLTATCTVTVAAAQPEPSGTLTMPNGDFSAEVSGWTYASTVEGLFAAGDPVPVQTDTDGNRYIQIPANGKVITGPTVEHEIKANEWIRLSFKVRKTDAGKMRFGVRFQGGMYAGYAQPDWTMAASATATSGDGEWFIYTVYAQAANDATKIYLQLLEISGNTTADLLLDVDDIELAYLGEVAEESLNLLPDGTMDNKSWNMNSYSYAGFFNDGAEIVADPDDAANSVMHIPAGTSVQAWVMPSTRILPPKANTTLKKDTVYKLTYRMKGAGTTSVGSNSSYGRVLQTIGEPGTASETWKTVTVYLKTTSSVNANYTFDFRNSGEVYLDDMRLYEVTGADSLTLDKATAELMPGDEVTLTATTTPPGITPVWTTSDANVATVANGTVTAVGEGTAVITATVGDKTATCTVTVTDPGEATAITLNKTEIYLVKGSSETLTVTTEPTASRYDSLSWATSDATLATVADGVVTAAADKEGEVTITATAAVGTTVLTATCKVIVVGNATAIEANVETLHLAEATDNGKITASETIDLTVTPTGAYTGTLSWTTSDAAVATVDENGRVTARAAGTATITVSNGTLSDTVTVTVDTFGERITGGDFEGNDWNVTYWTNNIIKEGRSSLAADPTNAENTVLAIPANTNADLWMWPALVNAGRTYKLTYKAMNADGRAVVYFENGKSVISGGGWQQKTIAKEGWTEVTHIFTMYGSGINRNYTFSFANRQAETTLYIDDVSLVELPEATALELTAGDTLELMPTGTATLTATTVPAEASAGTLTWTTSDASIVAVTDKGVITAVASSGSAVITVINDKGLTDSVTVTINEYANLLENGDFEQGTNRWGGDWAAEMIQPGIGKDGSYGFKAHNTTGSARGEAYYKKAIPVQPATTYILTFDYYATENSKQLRIYSKTLNIGSKYAANGDGEWKTATKIFTTKADMSLHTNYDLAIVVDGEGGEDVVIDNVCLKLYDTGVEATSIKLNYEALMLMPGRTGALTINPYPTEGNINRATWTSSNEDVATVEYGVVTAVGKGTATVTVTLRNGLSATCEVTVSGEEAYVKNGTFADAEEWTTGGASAIADGVGAVAKDGTISQTVTGLKPETTYQLFVRYRSENSSKLGIDLVNGTTALLDASETAGAAWTKKTYEFTTPATVAETSTLTFAVDAGNGPVYIDHILLAQKATLVDLKVDSVVWTDSEQVTPGTELAFAVTFTNYGEDAIKAGSTIDIDICVDSKPVQTLTYTVGNAGFASGDTDMIIGTETWAAVEGDHVVSARINSTMSVLEMNVDNNNTVQADLRVSNEILPVPEIAENAGFNHLTFSDDFNSLHTIDQYGTGADGYKWYITRPYSAPNVETDDYSIENGVMNLRLKSPNYNYGLGTMDIKTGLGYEFRYGYMEFRIRMHDYDSDGEGGPAIWSLPYDKLVNQCTRWVEMDWMEYWGTPSYAKDGRYTVTMHDNTLNDPAGEHWYKNPNHAVNAMGDGEWHVLGYLWDHGVVIAYLDGEEVMRQTYDPEDGVWPAATVASGEDPFPADAYQPMNTHALPVTICGSLDNQMDIDYIRIWTGTGGGSIPEGDSGDDGEGDGELGEGDIIVDIAADEFWHNYCTDDWGDPIKTIDEYNYAYVVEGALYWPLLSAERQAEINALLAENGQPTFEELAAAVDEFMAENPATVFVDMFLKDENGEPIMEATADNFEQLLASALVFVELDTDTQLAIVELMAANGQPRYDELLMQALAMAEEQGWTDFEVPEVEVPTPENIPGTGATGIPAALAVALLISAAALTVLRKRTAK